MTLLFGICFILYNGRFWKRLEDIYKMKFHDTDVSLAKPPSYPLKINHFEGCFRGKNCIIADNFVHENAVLIL